jgi:hypothetical protein
VPRGASSRVPLGCPCCAAGAAQGSATRTVRRQHWPHDTLKLSESLVDVRGRALHDLRDLDKGVARARFSYQLPIGGAQVVGDTSEEVG